MLKVGAKIRKFDSPEVLMILVLGLNILLCSH